MNKRDVAQSVTDTKASLQQDSMSITTTNLWKSGGFFVTGVMLDFWVDMLTHLYFGPLLTTWKNQGKGG